MNAHTTATATRATATCEDCDSAHAFTVAFASGEAFTVCHRCAANRGLASALPTSGVTPVVASGAQFVNGLDHPQNVIDMALSSVAPVQTAYHEGHDALGRAFHSADRGHITPVALREQMKAIRTEEFDVAHQVVVWAVQSIARELPRLAERVGQARADLYLEERAARYGVKVETVTVRR